MQNLYKNLNIKKKYIDTSGNSFFHFVIEKKYLIHFAIEKF